MSKYRGFTVIELIVSLSVMVIIASIFLADYRRAGSNKSVQGVALDVSVAIRQAQIFSAGRRESSAGTGDFTKSYGVYFEDSFFVIFVDNDDSQSWSAPETINLINLPRGLSIDDLCADSGAGVVCGLSSMYVIFPNNKLDSIIIKSGVTIYQKGSIHIKSSSGTEEVIEVFSNGYAGISMLPPSPSLIIEAEFESGTVFGTVVIANEVFASGGQNDIL